ncbi:hypothetical protein Tco_0253170, partial [Tanacetum coccineum]
VLTEDVVRSLSAPVYCRDLDTITLRADGDTPRGDRADGVQEVISLGQQYPPPPPQYHQQQHNDDE